MTYSQAYRRQGAKCPNWPRCRCIAQGYINRREPNDCGKKPEARADGEATRGFPMKRPRLVGDVKPGKTGNLLGEVPLDVPYAGCHTLDCIPGCDLAKNHCERLAQAFKRAGYEQEIVGRDK